ncbi:class I SAM-dependent methyltransferase [Thermovenabulum gondwanense]|uniref:Demethylrebeccamycin-D-glucose O-methyltransferase n=1 Tax=Thermovenabulum gondwanense TaxID=520767 RepID=A0A162MRG8_9FIRM|nr:class I SAM-dependent methyltransferase [Thermovenabulum gondwanense]KYO67006.1 Demethylrebeccamycin-D-glucose O-methyltransferase [Thermovenabulum gondwanense]
MALTQKEFFNNLALEWDDKVKHDPFKLREIINLVNFSEGAAVLDVGCGTGVLVPYINEKIGKSGRIVGLDIAEKMIQRAREKFSEKDFPNVNFVVGDIMDYNFSDSFDFIICYSSFPHFPDKIQSIKKMASLLKPKGKLIICHSESREKINNLHRSLEKVVCSDVLPAGQEVAEYMCYAGLKIEKVIDDDDKFVVIGMCAMG